MNIGMVMVMINNFLIKIMLLSLSASIIATILFAIKPLVKVRLTKTWQYYIWLVVVLRMLIPYTPEQSLMGGLYNFIDSNSQVLSTANNIEITGTLGVISNYIGLGWLSIVALLLLKKIISYHVYVRFIKTNRLPITDIGVIQIYDEVCRDMEISKEIGLYSYRMTNSPMLIGFFKPYIVLPETMLKKTDSLKYVILHEMAHYKRKDFIYKWLIQIVSCVHFFNPIIFLIRDIVSKDCELSCDETVIRKLDNHSKKAYGSALINSLESDTKYKQPTAVSLMLCEDIEQIKDRLDAILHYKQSTNIIMSVTFILTGFICFSTIYVGVFKNIFSSCYCHYIEDFIKSFM